MKPILFFCMLFFVITSPAYSRDLSDADLNRIRLIVKEEIAESEKRLKEEIAESEKRLKEEIAESEKQMKLYVDTKFESTDKRMTLIVGFVSVLIVLIVVTVGIPRFSLLYAVRTRRNKTKELIN